MQENLFFDTVGYNPKQITAYTTTAKSQAGMIERYYQQSPGKEFTPSEIWSRIFKRRLVPLTSVRRAMTTLTYSGVLSKTDNTRMGLYGKCEHTYKAV